MVEEINFSNLIPDNPFNNLFGLIDPIRINSTVNKIQALNSGMTWEECLACVMFIEFVPSGILSTDYLRKEASFLPRTIEFDNQNNRIFIHLKTHGVDLLGKGAHKLVTTSILYDREAPRLVATAVMEVNEKHLYELELLQKFAGLPGIIAPLYISRHTKKTGEEVYELVTPLANKGSLKSVAKRGGLTLHAMVSIAQDILRGASALNEMGYVPRDNHAGNFLIHEENGKFSAFWGDLGGYTHTFAEALRFKPLGPHPRNAPPDVQFRYWQDNLDENDLVSLQVFTLGKVFYYLFYGQEVPWAQGFKEKYPFLYNLHHTREPIEIVLETERFTQEILALTSGRVQELYEKECAGTLTPQERFESMILDTLSVDPAKRRSSTYWLSEIERLSAELAPADRLFGLK